MYRSPYRLGIVKRCALKDLDPKRPKHKWCLYTKRGKRRVLGRHLTPERARLQEKAIKIRQHIAAKRGKK